MYFTVYGCVTIFISRCFVVLDFSGRLCLCAYVLFTSCFKIFLCLSYADCITSYITDYAMCSFRLLGINEILKIFKILDRFKIVEVEKTI